MAIYVNTLRQLVRKQRLSVPGVRATLLVTVALARLTASQLPAQTAPSQSPSDSLATLEQQFRDLPMNARCLTGPLFWLHGDESQALLKSYVEKVAQGGNGCFTAESRPHADWLGPTWYRDLQICLDAARKHHLQMWIFDEKWWPSQGVAGNVPPRYAAKKLEGSFVEVEGPCPVEARGYAGERYVAAVAGRLTADKTIESQSLVDLASFIRQGKLAWQAPAGRWRVMKFTYMLAPGLGQGGGTQLSVDGMSKDCVDWFIQTVYQPHYDRFKDDFGKTIAGYFYDEPETRGDWGTELNTVLAENKVDWKKAYVAYMFQLADDEQTAARFQYLDARAETWGRTMYGLTTKWCQQRGVKSIGHFMEHRNLYVHPEFCAGDMMRVQKYSDMGGIDAVFSQFRMGQRDDRDTPCWQTPKLGSSITHAYGKPDDVAMVEIFGARGQDLTYPEMKWWTDHMHVSGINFLIPHSFNPRSPRDTDCPPYFYNNGHEPRWPLYRVFADYTSRLSLMLTGGRHVCPVALLSLGQSRHVGESLLPDQISAALQDALYDCDWIPYDVFENDIHLDGPQLALRRERYRVLILPAAEVIPYPTLKKAKDFYDGGGVVLAYGILPSKSATIGRSDDDINTLAQALWPDAQPSLNLCNTSPTEGRSYFLPAQPTPEQLQQVLAGDASIHPTLEVIKGDTNHWLHVLHRVKGTSHIFFICNQNADDLPRPYRFRLTAPGFPECWDPLRNEITAVPFQRQGPCLELDLTLESNQSLLLVLSSQRRNLPPRIEPGLTQPLRTIPVHTLPAPQPDVPSADLALPGTSQLKDCSWIWDPQADPTTAAPVGTCFFRKLFTLPADFKTTHASFLLTADNAIQLYVNGKPLTDPTGGFNDWQKLTDLDIAPHLLPTQNCIAIAVTNQADTPNPAGLIGIITLANADGQTLLISTDASWKTTQKEQPGWSDTTFDDTQWAQAAPLGPFGIAPWQAVGAPRLTLSPVPKADPYYGQLTIPADLDLADTRACLEMQNLHPEAAARVYVNDHDAGGFIGKPLRLDITRFLHPGPNRLRIEPFTPKEIHLAIYPNP